MTTIKFGIGFVLVLAITSSSFADTGIITRVEKLLIDTDAGGDDAVALLMALGAEEHNDGVKIIGITCVNGNTDVDQVALNVLKVLKVADRLDVPVYRGAAHPILLPNQQDYYFGKDGFGDFYFPDAPSADLIQSTHAVNAMIDLVKASPGEITLLALGPLTNVALAIRMYPKFLEELQQLVVMGGSTEGLGNARPGIEFNFFADPVANYIVFNSTTINLPILAPLEVTQRTHVTMEFRMALSEFNNAKVWLIDNAGGNTLDPEAELWFCADAAATAIALTSGSIVTKSGLYYSDAIYDGVLTTGMILVDYKNITENPANTNLIQNLDVKVYEKLLLRYFSS